jgi:hypothetical protein
MAERTRARGGLDTIDIKGKQYVTVAERIKAVTDFDNLNENLYEIEKWERFELGGKLFLTCHIVVGPSLDPKAEKTHLGIDTRKRYSGTSQISFSGGMVNATSGYENAETSALGRALGFAGIGLIEGVASADEIHKANHQASEFPEELPVKDVKADAAPTEKQIGAIKKLLYTKGVKTAKDAQIIFKEWAGADVAKAEELTKAQASAMMDHLVSAKEDDIKQVIIEAYAAQTLGAEEVPFD